MAENKKATLVPIAILVNGKFYDASAYKADPVPMALESGTVYEGERTGNSLGLFTVGGALHSNAANAANPWIATGAWHPTGTEAASGEANKEMKADSTPVGIGSSDEPPRLTKDPNAVKKGPDAGSAPAGGAGSAPSSTSSGSKGSGASSSGSSSGSGDEPPRLTRPAESTSGSDSGSNQKGSTQSGSAQSGAAQSGSAQSGSTQSGSGSGKPASAPAKPDNKNSDAKPTDSGSIKEESAPKPAASDSGANAANRPRLRRGRPAESFADEEIPGYSKPGEAPTATPGKIVATSTATSGPVQLIPAISDAKGPEPRSYTFEWIKGEEDERRQQIMTLAKEKLRAYVDAQMKNRIAANPVPAKSVRAGSKKPPEPIFGAVQMVAYDIWANNQPVIIFTADAQMPPPSAGAPQTGTQTDMQYFITLIAYPDIYNNLRQIYAAVTDKFHLDVTPRLELVDAVDADGDGRGELLFKETSDLGTGWVIYTAGADRLAKRFDSLNAE